MAAARELEAEYNQKMLFLEQRAQKAESKLARAGNSTVQKFAVHFELFQNEYNTLKSLLSDLRREGDDNNTAVGETLLEQYPIEVSVYGGIVVPLVTSLGMVFINKDYLKPFKDIKRGVDLYERINDAGELYIAVKDGFMLCSLILPLDIINKEFSDSLCKLAELTRVSFENKKANERDGQINITEVLELDEEQ